LYALVFLFGIGCGTAPNADTLAARELLRSLNKYAEIVLVEGPEYATIPKIPKPPDRSAACGVRIRFRWQDGGRTTNDDWVIWVTSDHKAIDWSGNPNGDNWREYVRSFARK